MIYLAVLATREHPEKTKAVIDGTFSENEAAQKAEALWRKSDHLPVIGDPYLIKVQRIDRPGPRKLFRRNRRQEVERPIAPFFAALAQLGIQG